MRLGREGTLPQSPGFPRGKARPLFNRAPRGDTATVTPRFGVIFRWHVVRHLRRHKLLALLNVLAVALGVAVYVAIQIANASADRAFAATVDVAAGKAQLEARGEIDESVLPLVSRAAGIAAATPLIEQLVTLPDFPGEYLRVLGVDVFTNAPFRTFQIEHGAGEFNLEEWLAKPDGIAISERFARAHRLQPGSSLRVLANGRRRNLRVTFLLKLDDAPAAADSHFAALDIGWAQELFDLRGRLTSIQLLLQDAGQAATVVKHLRAIVPATARIAPPRQRSLQIGKMLGAFQLNLSALSMVSLLVGVFLIYNTISASAARRGVEIGMLRALGATRMEIRALFLGEAALFGAFGIVLGLGGGIVLAHGLVASVARTISSLYVLVSVSHVALNNLYLFIAALFGAGAVMAGAWMPAREAANVDPVQSLALGGTMSRSLQIQQRWTFAGIGLLFVAGLCAWGAFTIRPWFGFAAAFFVLAGFALFAPIIAAVMPRIFQQRRWLLPRLAAENLARSAHRNAVTIAALASAVAMAVGVSIMIFSFRDSVDTWIRRGLAADLFIAPASNEVVGLSAFVPPEAIEALKKMTGIASVDTYRELTATMRGEPVEIGVVHGVERRDLRFVGGNERRKMTHFFGAGNHVFVTESFAQKYRVRDGDLLPIETPGGLAVFEVAGIYYDYTSDRGLIMIDQAVFESFWHDPRVQSLAVYLAPHAEAGRVAREFRRQFSAQGEFSIYPNRALRQRILAIFDQTFAVTYVVRAIAVAVAVVGIFLSITALVVERAREIGIFRALGASRAQVRNLFLAESALIGAIASVLGLASGSCLAMVLTWVINKAFFGWTIALQWPGTQMATTPAWIVAAAVAAAWWPAAQASRIEIATAVRSE